MRNNRGQALVEFILILPVLILIIFCFVDFGTVISKKYKLENNLDTIVNFYQNKEEVLLQEFASKNKLTVSYETENKTVTIKVSENISFITPGLGKIIGNPYKIDTSRVIYENG